MPSLTCRQKPSTEKLTRNVAPNTAQKGDPSDVKSFLDVHVSEPKCAAYVGYKDVAEYRKLLLSHLFFPYYLFYAQHFASKTGSKSAKVALELLRDLREPDTDFPAKLPDMLWPSNHSSPCQRPRVRPRTKLGRTNIIRTTFWPQYYIGSRSLLRVPKTSPWKRQRPFK